MDKVTQYVALTVLACLALLAAGWMFLIAPKKSEAADLREQTAATEAANNQLRTKLSLLKAQAKDLPKEQAKLAAVAAQIPDNPALPALIRALTAASTSAGVELVSVTPGPPAAPVVAVAPVVSTPGASPAPAAAPVVPGAVPAGGAAGTLAVIPLTMNVVGGFFQVQTFLAQLERLPRSLRVVQLGMVPGANPVKPGANDVTVEDGRSLSATITAQAFMAVNRPADAGASIPASPTASK